MSDASAEFDPVEIARIIEDALRESTTPHASFLDIQVMAKLNELLPQYMNPADASYIINSIRHDVYEGFKIPSSEHLHKVIDRCIKCADEIDPNPQRPHWNVMDPDLLLVAANPESIRNYGDLLASSLKQSGFRSDRCCQTFVTRCPMEKPSNQCIKNCVPYLHTEIHALKPKLIIALGLEAYVAVTGNSNQQMKSILGRVQWFGLYPVLVQYSPGYFTNLVEKTTTDVSQYVSIFKQAHSHIYGS